MSTPHTGCGSSTHKNGLVAKSRLALPMLRRFTVGVRFFGVVDVSLSEAVELFVRREDAERTLAELVRDEPQWQTFFRIEPIELGDRCWN